MQAYERLPAERQKTFHAAAARAIKARPAWERDELLATLGRHWEQAAEALRAGTAYLAAARRAKAKSALAEAERLYRAYLRLAEHPSRSASP